MKKNKFKFQRFGIFEKKESNHWFFKIILILALFISIYLTTIFVQNYIKSSLESLEVTNDLNSTWIGSLASYWGGILGGGISGLVTFIGVAWTIRYYHNSDKIKSRLEFLPFLNIDVVSVNIIPTEANYYKINSNSINDDTLNKKTLYFKIKIENIGRGFANVLVIHTHKNAGGMFYKKLIQVNSFNEFYFKVHTDSNSIEDELNFEIQYVDCMTNEYIQNYSVKWKNKNFNNLDIDIGYPNFMGQTHNIIKL